MNTPDTLTIIRPDDWHVHLRDGAMLRTVAPATAARFARAIIMPNLASPVTSIVAARDYRDRIIQAIGTEDSKRRAFTPLMTCYLTDEADPDEIRQGYENGVFTAVKLYPAGATTNSAAGVTDIKRVSGVLESMQKMGMPLLVHGEVTDPGVDIFDREAVFINRVLEPLLRDFPALKVVFEHITTSQAVAFVRAQGPRMAATITAHHLMITRNALFQGGIRPHLYCLPVAKREQHRLALREAATSGEDCFFLGTDSAPHVVEAKESGCGCAGIYSAPAALELYTQVFDEERARDKLEAFASRNGPCFYGLPVNQGTVTLRRQNWVVPESLPVVGGRNVIPFRAGEMVPWKLFDDEPT